MGLLHVSLHPGTVYYNTVEYALVSNFLSKAQLLINSTDRRFHPKVSVNCLQDVLCSGNLIPVNQNNYEPFTITV